MNVENPDEIYTWDTNKLWNAINQIREEEKNEEETSMNEKEYQQIKNGIKIEIPIQYINNEWYELYPSSKRVKILGYGKIPITTFLEEKEERDTKMRQIIQRHIEPQDDIITGR